jgi:hypothetical protein
MFQCTRAQPDPWTRLEIAATSLKQPEQDTKRRLFKALYALPDALQEGPDFDALERTVLSDLVAREAALALVYRALLLESHLGLGRFLGKFFFRGQRKPVDF